jgi:hypothetical protein
MLLDAVGCISPGREETWHSRQMSEGVRTLGVMRTGPGHQVFISYSHQDTPEKNALEKHLYPREFRNLVRYWSDSSVEPGSDWAQKIQAALDESTIAVCLLSKDYFASPFISRVELPQILKYRDQGRLTIISVILAPCAFKGSGLEKYQALPSSLTPLRGMQPFQQDQTWEDLAGVYCGPGIG